MNDITSQWGSTSPSRGLSRRTGRVLANLDGQTEVATARAHAKAEKHAAQVDALSAVTQRGMQGVAFMSQVEQQLAQAVPLAASRLEAIGNVGTLGLTQIIMDAANDLRRG